MNKKDFQFNYPVPLYRAVVCVPCKKGFDSHERMFASSNNPKHELICTSCGGNLQGLLTLELRTV